MPVRALSKRFPLLSSLLVCLLIALLMFSVSKDRCAPHLKPGDGALCRMGKEAQGDV